ncbi:hypothetical protein ColTof3_11613 [Colletotrichum tofieldiae]|nr:hypothetical protein ColTof3_11613 [Colletotrichum tofieldiae]
MSEDTSGSGLGQTTAAGGPWGQVGGGSDGSGGNGGKPGQGKMDSVKQNKLAEQRHVCKLCKQPIWQSAKSHGSSSIVIWHDTVDK